MARYECTSAEYLATIADKNDDAAFYAYIDKDAKAKAVWDAIPDCEAKDSAYDNADCMMYTEKLIMDGDTLGWFRAAISTYEFNCDMA